MIGYIAGNLIVKEPTHVIIDVGGVGYEVKISLNTYSKIKQADSIQLQTYLHVKEDALTLYGFIQASEKNVFLDLISINGVGPSTALMVLSSLSAEEFQSAVVNEDVKTIQSVKGIGGKTAQRVVLELRDKLRKFGVKESQGLPSQLHNTLRSEALTALTTLGISKQSAEKSIDSAIKKWGDEISLEELVKQALKSS